MEWVDPIATIGIAIFLVVCVVAALKS